MFDYYVKYRSGTRNENADAFSRLTVENETSNDLDLLNDEEPNVINAIHLNDTSIQKDQYDDQDLKWIYNLKKEAINKKVHKIEIKHR
jgi:hypothetical protein